MATIQTAIQLYDGVSGSLYRIDTAVHSVLDSLQEMQAAGNKATDAANMQQAGGEILNAGIQTIKMLTSMSDQVTTTTARLNFIVDDRGIETLQDQIMGVAMRSRALYTQTADAISKMGILTGTTFSDNDELMYFVETMNKQLKIAGTDAGTASGAISQLTQALSSGVLGGEEFNSVNEAMPLLMNEVAKSMGVAKGELKDLASDGAISADIIKNAMFSAGEEIDATFQSMPMTWAQVWTQMQNIALIALQPILDSISWTANNIEIIGPLVLGVAGAFLTYQIAVDGVAAATKAWAAAQAALSISMAAHPVVWIVMAVIALIGIIYAVVAVINKVTESSISATGIILGTLMTAGAFIINLFVGVINAVTQLIWSLFITPFIGIIEWILNVCMGGFDSFGDGVANLIGQIIGWFLDLGKVVTTIIDAMFGTNWTSGLENLRSKVVAWGKNENAITVEHSAPQLNRIEYGSAWDAGYNFGAGIENKIGDMFGFGDIGNPVGDMGSDLTAVAENTGKMADAMEIAEEDIKYMRDIAEQKAINRFTFADVSVQMTNHNNVNSEVDLDGVANHVFDVLWEQSQMLASGVHS